MGNTPMKQMQYDGLVEFITKHNALVAKINAATGDKDSLTESISESDEFADQRAAIAELQEALEAAVAVKVDEALASASEDTTEVEAEVKDLKSTISSGISYYKKLYKDEDAEFPKIDRVKGQRTGGGSGGKRVRGYNVIVTVGDDTDEYPNFASAAKALGAETSELQEQFFSKAGVEQLKDAPDEVTFGLSWVETDEDGTETTVSATVKAYRTGPSGPPAKEASSDDVAAPAAADAQELTEF